MNKIIKLTKKQLIEATESNPFTYLEDSDVPHNDGNSHISVGGKITDNEYSDPITTDKIANTITNQQYPNYRNLYYNRRSYPMDEGSDKDQDGVDDFYENNDNQILSNGVENDNLTRIPETVDSKLSNLIKVMELNRLTPKQQSMVLYKVIDSLQTSLIPPTWKRELILKLNARK